MEKIKIKLDSETDVPNSYIDSRKYVEEVFQTGRPDDILRLTQEDSYIIIETDILDFKLSQLFQLNNIIPIVISEPDKKIKSRPTKLDFAKYYYNLDQKAIYRSAEDDNLEVVGLIFFDTFQKPILDSKFQRTDFLSRYDLSTKKISKMETTSEIISAKDVDSKLFYFGSVGDTDDKISAEIEKFAELSNYLLSTRDTRIRLRDEIKPSVISNIFDQEISYSKTLELNNLIALFDYLRLDIGLIFSDLDKDAKKKTIDILRKKMETKLHNYLESIKDITQRDSQNYYRSLCKAAYIRKFGIEKYNDLPRLRTAESTFNTYPIIPDILPLLDKKTAAIVSKEADIMVQNNLVDATIYAKNRRVIQLANSVKTEKFPDLQWKKFRELITKAGLNLEKPFVTDPNWIVVDGIKVLCRHYYVSMTAAKKKLSKEEIHKKLLEFAESDSSVYCKICSEVLTYRDKYEGLVSTYEEDGFKSSYDETFRIITRAANIWVHGYLTNTYNDNDYATGEISKNIANILYDFLKPTHDKLLSQKNKDPVMVMKKFNLYVNTYVGAAIIKIVEDNSKTLGIYGVEKLTQNILVEEVFKIIKKIIGNDLYIFEDITEAKVEQGIKNAYKTLTDTISKLEYKNRSPKLDYDPYKEMLLSINKSEPIPPVVSEIVAMVDYIRKHNVLYNAITIPSHDNLSIEYSENYLQYLQFLKKHEAEKIDASYRYWITSTLLVRSILRQSYEFDKYVNSGNKKENLNLVYGTTKNHHNLKKMSTALGWQTDKSTADKLHKHLWSIPIWGKKGLKWNGTISDSSITFSIGKETNNLSYIDSLCKICGKSLMYPGDDDTTVALKNQNEVENFYRYFRFICPKDNSDHKFVDLKDGSQKCTKCGLELVYISERNESYYLKYHHVYEKETKKKSISFQNKTTSITKKDKPVEQKKARVDPQFSKRLAEELSEKMEQDKNKRQTLLTKLNKLGNTEGVLYNTKELPDPNRIIRGITLDYYLLKIIGLIGMARRSELRDMAVPKIAEIVKLNIRYEKFSEPLGQYDNIISILGRISKIDNKFAMYIANNLFLSDQHNSKLEKKKEAEIQSNINYEQADQSFIDLEISDSDVLDPNAENMFSYENMDYDGHNDEG